MEKELKKRMTGSQELFFGIFLSAIFVWMMGLLDNCLTPCYINGLFILFAVVITIVAYKKRTYAMSFLLSFCARWLLMATVFPLGLLIIQSQENKTWLYIAIVFVVSVLGSVAKESVLWKKSKTEYENKGVINLKEGRFSILQWLSIWDQDKSKKSYWGTLIGSLLGVLIYQLLLGYFIRVSQVVVIVAFLFLTSLLSWKLGRGLFWAIKIRQMEKTLHFKFKTEFDEGFMAYNEY